MQRSMRDGRSHGRRDQLIGSVTARLVRLSQPSGEGNLNVVLWACGGIHATTCPFRGRGRPKGGLKPVPLHWGRSSRVAAQAPARGPPGDEEGLGAPPGAPVPIPSALAVPLQRSPLQRWPGSRHPNAVARERAQALGQHSRGP
eukprot:3347013-Amphidinium_carterae.1